MIHKGLKLKEYNIIAILCFKIPYTVYLLCVLNVEVISTYVCSYVGGVYASCWA